MRPSIAVVALTALSAALTAPAPARAEPNCPGRRPLADVPPDGETVDYLGRVYSADDYATVKAAELDAFGAGLHLELDRAFETRGSKYFAIAYRVDEAKMRELERLLDAFYAQVYPRYFDCELGEVIHVIYYDTRAEFVRLTDSDAYGFYVRDSKTISTYGRSGHGTLWHELMHAFLDQNLACTPPEWLDEGLASFYEMAFLKDGQVVEGFTNWRLPYLKEAIRKGELEPLARFLADDEIRSTGGLALARFLFLYLWVHDALVPFVRTWVTEICPIGNSVERNDRAVQTLEELLGMDLATIEQNMKSLARKVKVNQKLTQE